MRTLYLHIGTHRTATSSIQAFMLANCDLLPARGILYPYKTARHLGLFNGLFSGRREVGEVAQDLSSRADKRQHPVHSIVLSDEDVCMRRDLSRLAEFRSHFNVKVIFALRRQDLWLESWFLQNIKWQWNKDLSHCTLAEFLAQRESFHWADYNRYVTHLEDLFGIENVLPYVFEKAQMPGGPVAAFARLIGLEDLTGLAPAPHVNSSHSPMVSEFMRCMPLDDAPPHYRALLEKACWMLDRTLVKSAADSSSLLIDPETRAAIMAEYAAGNSALAQRHFGREALFLDPMPAPDAALAPMVLPADSYALMRDYVEPMIRGLIAQNMEPPVKPLAKPLNGPDATKPLAVKPFAPQQKPGKRRNAPAGDPS